MSEENNYVHFLGLFIYIFMSLQIWKSDYNGATPNTLHENSITKEFEIAILFDSYFLCDEYWTVI